MNLVGLGPFQVRFDFSVLRVHDHHFAKQFFGRLLVLKREVRETFADQRGSLCGWLAVVTRNRAIDRIRGSRRLENVEDLQLSNSVDLGAEAEREILLSKVRGVLDTMPEEQRQAVEMAFFEGHTHTEIAQQTGQPLGTVKTRIRSALISIRKALEISA